MSLVRCILTYSTVVCRVRVETPVTIYTLELVQEVEETRITGVDVLPYATEESGVFYHDS